MAVSGCEAWRNEFTAPTCWARARQSITVGAFTDVCAVQRLPRHCQVTPAACTTPCRRLVAAVSALTATDATAAGGLDGCASGGLAGGARPFGAPRAAGVFGAPP